MLGYGEEAMPKRLLAIVTSPRENSNSELLARRLAGLRVVRDTLDGGQAA